MKVMTIVGTRPEIIRLSETIKLCDRCFDHIIVHTGQNYDPRLNEIFFQELGIRRPDYYLDSPGEDLGVTVGNIISRSYSVMKKEKPDALLVLGDTNSSLASYSAKRLKIPIFHMEAGNRCFDQNVPEEINRKIIDHLADVNLPYTEHSRRYLISEGLDRDTVFVTGSPMYEVLQANIDKILSSRILEELCLDKRRYFLVSLHREENLDIEEKLHSLVVAINKVAEEYGCPIIFSTHPRTLKKIQEKGLIFNKLVKNLEPFGFSDYCNLQMNSYCVLSDSGTVPEESAMLNFPAISIRTSIERPEALEQGTVLLAGVEDRTILQSIELITSQFDPDRSSQLLEYMIPNTSERVVNIIQSYTHVINRRAYQK